MPIIAISRGSHSGGTQLAETLHSRLGYPIVSQELVAEASRHYGVSEDEQTRLSAVWEYSPFQFLQGRIGYRNYGGIPQNPAQNREQLFAELHVYF